MDDWMNRFRAFAEAVVIMVCPVLLAIALKKVNLKSEEHGRAVPIVMLVVAAVSLIAGIFPYLICCISKISNDRSRLPHSVTRWLAPLSCACLIALVCWIIRLIIYDDWAYPAIGAVFGFCIVVRTVGYFCEENARESDHATVSKLENSLEFLSGVTALLFLGLEGLALEGQIKNGQGNEGIEHRLAVPMGSSFIACVLGVSFMLVETIPPLAPIDNNAGCYGSIISNLTEIFDVVMAVAVGGVMFSITYTLVELQALVLLVPPFLILVMHVIDVAVGRSGSGNNNAGAGGDGATGVTSGSSNRGGGGRSGSGNNNAGAGGDGATGVTGENPKPASLELTKVTFTGFLAVSVPSISSGSLNKCTDWFLVLAASGVVSGLVWRLLTHTKSAVTGNAPIYASFCAHLCVAIATVPFTLMAGNALSAL